MARQKRSRTRRSNQFRFTHQQGYNVTVKPAEFVYFKSLRLIDQSTLSRGRHKIEVGYLKAPCCKRLVTAVVARGVITRLEVEPCSDTQPVPPEFRRPVDRALEKLRSRSKVPQKITFAAFAAQKIDAGALFPCGWIIITPNVPGTQQGIVVFCCIKFIDFGPIKFPVLNCGALPYPPISK